MANGAALLEKDLAAGGVTGLKILARGGAGDGHGGEKKKDLVKRSRTGFFGWLHVHGESVYFN
jgi:hypothetical protein